jgi:hypothetical protein
MSNQSEELIIRRSRWVALTAIMTALALVGNYALVGLPNVELATTVFVLTAYSFGLSMAVWSTLIMSLIFSTINPWGAGIPLIWFGQFIGWIYAAFVGAGLGRAKNTSKYEFVFAAIACTFVFQMSVNIAYSLSFSISMPTAILTGFPYFIIQLVTNTVLFPLVIPVVNRAIRDGFAGVIWEPQDTAKNLGEE